MSNAVNVTIRTWWWPTARTMNWSPLAAGVLALLCVGVLARVLGYVTYEALPTLGVGVLAGAATAAVNDTAGELVHAVATSARTRLLRRLALVVLVCGVVTATLMLLGRAAFHWTESAFRFGACVAALLTLGVATHCLALRRWPHHATDLAASAACIWPFTALLFPTVVLPASIAMAWFDHPGTVLVVGVVVTIVACGGCNNRGTRPKTSSPRSMPSPVKQ